MDSLSERVTSRLQEVVGLELTGVHFFCFDYEVVDSPSITLPYYFGGEVILRFGSEQVVITWDECHKWEDHFSLYAGEKRLYLPTSSLIKWDVSSLKPWCDCISRQLVLVQVYSQNATPHVVELNFGETKLFIGDSAELCLGDGDDVMITDNLSANYYGDWHKVWSCSL